VLYEMLTGEVPFKGENSVSVAMKHVRETLPDVQRKRPQTSAALAAVVERATAKDVASRYPSVSDMVRDLEEVLTYEAARAGGAEGEATSVLDQLPQRSKAGRARRVARLLLLLAAVIGASVAGVIAIRSVGNGNGGSSPSTNLSQIRLGAHDAVDYDPAPGDGQENRSSVDLALDGDRSTVWSTEHYDTAELGSIKDGVGVYLDAGRPVVAKALRISTPKKGWSLALYVANTVPDTVAEWTKVGGGTIDASAKTFSLDTGGQRFRYFLVWITRLAEDGSGRFAASVSELKLLG
jgi:serine/threonine-protein kinase